MVEKEKVQISEQEAELYDRQIRLWGLDAQKRLRASRILVIGMRGMGCEVSKNLVLAGVKSLKMVDSENVTDEDAVSQFLAPRDKVGSNRAEASLDRLQQLNPMVEVTADTRKSSELQAEFFKDFDVVIATTCTKEELLRINEICRTEKVMFYAGDVFGSYGFSFMDLIQHEYVEEVLQEQVAQEEGEEPPTKKAKGDAEKETKTVKKDMAFIGMADALKVDWTSELYAKRVKRMDPSFFVLQILFAFQGECGHPPRPSKRAEDLEKLKELRDSVLKSLSIPVEKVTDELLSSLFAELSPVCAIVGGILSQEVIKAISNKDAPFNNFFFYNPALSCGVVETIGY